MKFHGVNDIIVFSRITGAALLVCGYLLVGLYIGRWLMANGYPSWCVPLALLFGLAAALMSGYLEIKSILKFIRKSRESSNHNAPEP